MNMKCFLAIVIGSLASASAAYSQDMNVNGNLNANGSVSANNGHVYASQYVVSVGNTLVGTYLSVGTYATFGTTLKVGPGMISGTGNTYSAVFGLAPTTNSYSSFVIGRYNIDKAYDGTTVTPGSWATKDPLFIVGNGSSSTSLNNAFAVYKDGTITMSKVQGDISMGVFGN